MKAFNILALGLGLLLAWPTGWAYAAAATVTITVTQSSAATVTAINCTPASFSIPDNTAAGVTVSTCAVTMSNGSAFGGVLKTDKPTIFNMSGLLVKTARALVAGDDTPAGMPNVVTISVGP